MTKTFTTTGWVIASLAAFLLIGAQTAFAASQGPNFPDVGTEVNGPGTIAWSSEGNITADDSSFATAVLTANAISEYLQATDFDFSIPSGATIDGIQVSINRFSSSDFFGNSVDDSDLFLVKGGSIVGTDHASTSDWPTTEGIANYGSVSDLWSTTWTSADINAANFGVALSVRNESPLTGRTASVDYIRVTVTYTVSGTLTLQKTVIKNNGGVANDTDWLLSAAGPTPISGAEGDASITNAVVNPGSYTLSESAGPLGYAPSAWVCVGGNQTDDDTVTIAAGQNVTCTITNDDKAPSLTLLKVVRGGNTVPSDWTLTATGPTGFSGPGPSVANDASFDAGTYDLSESGPAGYTASDWVCAGGNQIDGGTIEIGLGEEVLCVLTNIFIEPEEPAASPCHCALHTETIQSDETNTVVGDGTAIAIVPSSAWTASIPGAAWVWKSGATAPNETVAFEQTFTVIGTVLSAQLQIASDNSYKVFIDNVQVAADASATNFTLATQDVHDLTAVVTPGVHTLRIEVTNNGVFSSLNPAGLLYRLVIESKECPPAPSGGISITICNSGSITNTTTSNSSTGGNTAGGSVGGRGGRGGDIDPVGNFNNGGASGGNGGNGGNAGPGGLVVTGNAVSIADTLNRLNTTRVRITE